MRVVVESFTKPRQSFYDLREQLLSEGRHFDEAALRVLPYDQLDLCCVANAGEAACTPLLVRREKRSRRERFVSMTSEEFNKCELFLRVQGMYNDVVADRATLGTPRWDDLNYRQKTWAKLNCLFNHLDNPHPRIFDTIGLLGRASVWLPDHVAEHYTDRLKGLTVVYPTRLTDAKLRSFVEEIRDSVRDFLPEPERSICLREQIRDFQCTSDCFRILI